MMKARQPAAPSCWVCVRDEDIQNFQMEKTLYFCNEREITMGAYDDHNQEGKAISYQVLKV